MDKVTVKEKQEIFYRELEKYGVKRDAKVTPENWGLVARVFNKLGIEPEMIPNFDDILAVGRLKNEKRPNFKNMLAAGKRKNTMLNQLKTGEQRGGVITYIWEAVNVVVDSLGGWQNIIIAGTLVAMAATVVNTRQPVRNAPRPPPTRPPPIIVNNTEDPQPMVNSPRSGGYRKKRRQTKRKHRRH
jgi:hypothetical protein